MGDGELKILLPHTKSSPTESARDPPYGEIQESYFIYNENAMQQCSPIESPLDSSYDKFKRLYVLFMI